MGRRNSGLDVLVELASLLPWWLSLIVAAVAWVGLGAFADAEVTPLVTASPSVALAAEIPRLLASVGRYVIPLAFVIGAATSAGRALRNRHLLRRVARHAAATGARLRPPSGKSDPLRSMSWQNFEHLVGEIYRKRGYSVALTQGGADGGVDIVLRRGEERILVQCKHWRVRSVGVSVIRELYGVVTARGAAGGAAVTVGHFTSEASAFARETGIELMDGEALRREAWLGDQVATLPLSSSGQEALATAAPSCPRCGSTMVERVARRGSRAGASFWGCSGFPKCRGIREP
jgi:restriction system protein